MNEERMTILKMVAEGKITAEEAESLLRTLVHLMSPSKFLRNSYRPKTSKRTLLSY